METPAAGRNVLPPWNNPHFFTEAGLRAAQEYFFQTHASKSRLIAEGRDAQGVMKSHVRRKLSKEMGEDFKMYTGSSIGEAQNSEDSKGIRGDLNGILEAVFIRVAPNESIESPIQEDVTILSHPLGALEVVFNMTCYYTGLQIKYASLASDRRKVLKSVLDEEMFKWVWRTFYALMLSNPARPPDFNSKISSTGISCVPAEKQQFDSLRKLIDIGTFLLGSSMAHSHLRYPICFYYVNFLRQIQYRMLPLVDRRRLDAVYMNLRKRTAEDPIEDVLTAIDFMMNTKGSTMHAFDDVLGDEDDTAPKYVPAGEIDFINDSQDFTGKRFSESMAKYVPKVSKAEVVDGEGVSMLPLLFLLRTLPYQVRERILISLPGPYLSLVRNRLAYGGDDDVSKVLRDRVDELVEQRRKRGESYTITSNVKGATARSLSADLSPAAGGSLPKNQDAADQTAREAQAPPAKASSAADEAPAAPPAKEAEAAQAQAPPAEAPSAKAPSAADEAPAAPPQQSAKGSIGQVMRERLIVSWWEQDGDLRVASIAPAEIVELVGMDVRFLVPWVLFAVRSGQVIRMPVDKLTKEVLERILKAMLKGTDNPREARLSTEQRNELYQGSKGKPPHHILLDLVEKHQAGTTEPGQAGTFSTAIASLTSKLGEDLTSFVKNPMHDEHRDTASQLTEDEKMAVSVLNKVARA